MAYTLDEFIKLNKDYSKTWNPNTKEASVTNNKTGKSINFMTGQGQEYGLGGLENNSHSITDLNKFKSMFEAEPQAYTSPYANEITNTLQALQNRKFNYNPNSDMGLQTAQSNAMDSVSKAAARRGMIYSDANKANMNSAALSLVPQFRNQAFSEYNQDTNNMMNNLSMYQNLDNTGYNRYRDGINDNRYDEELAYGRNYQTTRDGINDNRYADETTYNRGYQEKRDTINDNRYNNEWNHTLERENIADNNSRYSGGNTANNTDTISSNTVEGLDELIKQNFFSWNGSSYDKNFNGADTYINNLEEQGVITPEQATYYRALYGKQSMGGNPLSGIVDGIKNIFSGGNDNTNTNINTNDSESNYTSKEQGIANSITRRYNSGQITYEQAVEEAQRAGLAIPPRR